MIKIMRKTNEDVYWEDNIQEENEDIDDKLDRFIWSNVKVEKNWK